MKVFKNVVLSTGSPAVRIFLCVHMHTCNPNDLYFWQVNPPKQGLFQSKQGSFGFQVYVYIYRERERDIYIGYRYRYTCECTGLSNRFWYLYTNQYITNYCMSFEDVGVSLHGFTKKIMYYMA